MISSQLNDSLARRYGDLATEGHVKKAFNFSLITEALEDAPDGAVEAECSVVFSDISGFSTLVADLSPQEIKEYLDLYYQIVIPIIYKHGGLVDQMLGDGIISVFTPVLSDKVGDDVFKAGLDAAREIVATCAGIEGISTKCAMHKDQAVICQVGDENYSQATIVGNIMTAVHRVESVATDTAVNMLMSIPEAKAMYEKVCLDSERRRNSGKKSNPSWLCSESAASLKGIGTGPQRLLTLKYVGHK